MRSFHCAALLCLALGTVAVDSLRPASASHRLRAAPKQRRDLPNPTHAGNLVVSEDLGSSIYYMFFEAEAGHRHDTPIILWLQGGPGCSSLFGIFYLNGPFQLQTDMTLRDNPGKWSKHYGMLFIDQPIATGFSIAGDQPIPTHELLLAADLYTALQAFYTQHSQYQQRPLYITGESYAGKYVPSITHYILQAQAMNDGTAGKLAKRRNLGSNVRAPVFKLGGMAIGNGFTDAVPQTLVQAEVAFNMGLIDTKQRRQAEAIQDEVVELVRNKRWQAARRRSDDLLAFITNSSALGTLEDIRRDKGYDAEDRVSTYLNLPAVKENIAAPSHIEYAACSKLVDGIMGHDVMKSVAHLVPDVIERSHVLLYQGQFDAECGVASNEAWLHQLSWPGHSGFFDAERRFWRDEQLAGRTVLGYLRTHHHLSHVVIRNAGHMVPHDRPVVSQRMIEAWIESAEAGLDVMDLEAAKRLHMPTAAAA